MINWQLKKSIDAVVFDCDGTLSAIEGIDELAALNGVGEEVKQLTAIAMGESGINELLYKQRLSLVRPTRNQVMAVAQQYFKNRTTDIVGIIKLLQRLGKSVYIVSAGLHPAVANFGALLHVPAANIFAVDIFFDEQGNFQDFNHASPLVRNSGKREIVEQLKQKHEEIAYVGDGMNDLSVYDVVTRFVGYGGAYFYEKVAERCAFYLKSVAMSPLLPLILTEGEASQLLDVEQVLYHYGLDAIDDGLVVIREKNL